MVKRILERIALMGIFFFLDLRDRIKRKKYKKNIISNPFTKKVCCVLALYEKQYLRKDILSLLKILKEKNIDVIGVNTKKIDIPEEYSSLFTSYIERDNYGRDFASYKTGVEEIYYLRDHKDIIFDRIIIINDSVFYSQNKLDDFVENLSVGSEDIIGATENYEVSRHIGSFCLSLSKNIFYHPSVEKFWREYKLTNTRPRVIKKGELGLSKTLFSLVQKEKIKILYDYQLIEKNMYASTDFVKKLISYRREEENYHADPKSFEEIIDSNIQIKRHYYFFVLKKIQMQTEDLEFSGNKEIFLSILFQESTICGYIDYLQQEININAKSKLYSILLSEIIKGSQIHLNCTILAMLGLPIIKLDLFFRNVIGFDDLNKISLFIDESESNELESLLMQRPNGYATLTGLNLFAFRNGYL